MSCSQPPEDEQRTWNEMLVRQGLSMDRGSSPSWLAYGWEYRESHAPFDYSDGGKTPDANEVANETIIEQLAGKLAQGMSLRKAAAQLGLAPGNASRSIKRYNNRVKTACYPPATPYEEGHDAD